MYILKNRPLIRSVYFHFDLTEAEMAYSRLLVPVLLCVCRVAESFGNECKYDQNGCSVAKDMPYRKTFEPACDKHDVCYVCGKVHGFDRRDCDNRFYYDMEKICESQWYWCGFCKWVYWIGVRAGGWLFHGHVEKYDCKSAKVNDCLKR